MHVISIAPSALRVRPSATPHVIIAVKDVPADIARGQVVDGVSYCPVVAVYGRTIRWWGPVPASRACKARPNSEYNRALAEARGLLARLRAEEEAAQPAA